MMRFCLRMKRWGGVFGETGEFRRAVEDALGHQMHHAFGAALDLAFDQQAAARP